MVDNIAPVLEKPNLASEDKNVLKMTSLMVKTANLKQIKKVNISTKMQQLAGIVRPLE